MPRFANILPVLLLACAFGVSPLTAFGSECTGGTPVTCQVGNTQFCTATAEACQTSSPGAQVVPAGQGGGGSQPTQPTQPTLQTADNDGGSNSNAGGQTIINPLKANSLDELLLAILRGVIQLGTIFLVLALVWTGFLFVYAQGAEERIKNARAALMWTVVGGLLLLGAQGIALVLQATVNAL